MSATESAQRAAVVAEARSWIGTPYHNCADFKGTGVYTEKWAKVIRAANIKAE
jgi:hypothetical protein